MEVRTGARQRLGPLASHLVPPTATEGARGWLYVLGGAILFVFLNQVLTGIALATKYIPSTEHAYASLQFITNDVVLGAQLRGMHFWGASAMVVLVLLHVARVFLTGSYKFPRELTWASGAILLLLTMAMAFTGQLLRWDENTVWSVVIGAHFAARVPLVGGPLSELLLAGDHLGGATLSRFYALHILAFPLLIVSFVAVHLYLVVHHGIAEAAKAGRPVDPETYGRWFERHLEREGKPYWPDAAWKSIAAGFAAIIVIAALAAVAGPQRLAAEPDPTALAQDPRPDWFLLWYYALLAVKPRGAEELVMVYLPLLAVIVLLVLPFAAPTGERAMSRRPWAVAAVLAVALFLGTLTWLGLEAPWVPAADPDPIPAAVVGAESGPVAEGAQLMRERACLHCHEVAGTGGSYGPDLTDVHLRLPSEEITVRIVRGIGDMPAYRDILSAEEIDAIVAFLTRPR